MKNRTILTCIALLLIGGAFYIRKASHADTPERAQPVASNAVSTTKQNALPSQEILTATSIAQTALVLEPAQTQASITDWRTYDPAEMTFAAYPDLPLTFQRVDSYMDARLDRHVWIGTPGPEGAFVTTAASKDEMIAVLSIPGADTYEFTITNKGTTVRQIPQIGETCMPIPPKATYPLVQQQDLLPEVAADITKVDVAVFYNPDTLAAAGSESTILTTILARLVAANQSLANSGVTNFQWNVTGVYPVVAYPTTNNLTDDLSAFGNSSSTIGSYALAKSIEVGADQSLLLVGGTRDFAGMAYILGTTSVVLWSQASFSTIEHELAHNFGCQHDRVTMEAPDSNGQYYYGHTLTIENSTYGTVMSYKGVRIPYFSNPSVSYQNVPTGIAADQPKAANNAKVLTDYAPTMAARRAAPSAPVITAQPISTTVTTGSSFSLSVTATGTNLIYQWNKAGVAISGATSSSYSKTAASDDQASYYVTVRNALGSVDSATVNVTVNAPVTPSPSQPSGGGGGGGGGGGAVSPWFILTLGSLAAARLLRKKNV